ncbi:transcription factor A, mitochondrial [Pseudochaenichthys georgianus]|uniref:transcription factor A, mitochondrial n=1 Tax=Pseudochaenichthys georgianus TaxID=52239 RepID=UPI00146B7525|nr:transcription factor A, mitochondrial [Pseudochaenichthys georgianus]
MAPFGLMTAGASWLAKSFSVFSCTSTLARCSSVLSATHITPVKYLSSQASGPPKKPENGYLRFVVQQRPDITRHFPGIKPVEIIKKVAGQWRMLTAEQKKPFDEAAQRARQQFKVDLQRYQALLTADQFQQETQEKKQRLAKRRSTIRKKELNTLGKPKRNRIPVNIFVSEHYAEGRGLTPQDKLKSLVQDWRVLPLHQKQIYTQLAQDDKIRYNNEIRLWEEHMVEIGRPDLVREKILPTKRKPAAKAQTIKKGTKKLTDTAKKAPASKTVRSK